jgi:hypothetical protein
LKPGNVVEEDKAKTGKDGVLMMRVALVTGHPGNVGRVVEKCPAGWVCTSDESGALLEQISAAEAWSPTVVVLPAPGEPTTTHPKFIGRTESFTRMMVLEQERVDAAEEQVDKELVALRQKHGTHGLDDASGKERDLVELKQQLEEKEAMLHQLGELQTTAHAAVEWSGGEGPDGEHLRHAYNDDPDGPPAELNRVGQRVATPVVAEGKHTYTIKQPQKPHHESHYRLRRVENLMRIEDVILHDHKRGQLIDRRQRAEEAFEASQIQYDATKAKYPQEPAHEEIISAWEKMGMVEAHLEHMNKLADGLPRPQDSHHEVNLEMYLSEVEAYDRLAAPAEEDITYDQWLIKQRERKSYRRYHIGAKVVTTTGKPQLGVVSRQETRSGECGVHVNFKEISIDGKGKQDKWIPLSGKRECSLRIWKMLQKNRLIEPASKHLSSLQVDNRDLSLFDE